MCQTVLGEHLPTVGSEQGRNVPVHMDFPFLLGRRKDRQQTNKQAGFRCLECWQWLGGPEGSFGGDDGKEESFMGDLGD